MFSFCSFFSIELFWHFGIFLEFSWTSFWNEQFLLISSDFSLNFRLNLLLNFFPELNFKKQIFKFCNLKFFKNFAQFQTRSQSTLEQWKAHFQPQQSEQNSTWSRWRSQTKRFFWENSKAQRNKKENFPFREVDEFLLTLINLAKSRLHWVPVKLRIFPRSISLIFPAFLISLENYKFHVKKSNQLTNY